MPMGLGKWLFAVTFLFTNLSHGTGTRLNIDEYFPTRTGTKWTYEFAHRAQRGVQRVYELTRTRRERSGSTLIEFAYWHLNKPKKGRPNKDPGAPVNHLIYRKSESGIQMLGTRMHRHPSWAERPLTRLKIPLLLGSTWTSTQHIDHYRVESRYTVNNSLITAHDHQRVLKITRTDSYAKNDRRLQSGSPQCRHGRVIESFYAPNKGLIYENDLCTHGTMRKRKPIRRITKLVGIQVPGQN